MSRTWRSVLIVGLLGLGGGMVVAMAINDDGTRSADTSMGASTGSATPSDPTDRAWRLLSFPEGTGEVADEAEATLEFDGEGMASGTGGCNRWAASYESAGTSFSFGLLRTTMMACPDEPRSRQEKAFFEALERVSSYEMSEGELRLLDEAGELLMTLETVEQD